MIIVLANKPILMHSLTLLSVSVMILSIKTLLKVTFELCRKSVSLEIYYIHHEMTDFTFHQKVNYQPSPANFGY